MPWFNIHKWIVRFGDELHPDFGALDRIISQESITPVTGQGNTVFHFAAINEQTTCLSYLLSKCIDKQNMINRRNELGETPLHWACSKGLINNIRILLNAGANPLLVDNNNNTIFHYAAEGGQYKLIRYLIKKKIGSDLIKLRNLEQKSPLEIATAENEKKIVRLLSF